MLRGLFQSFHCVFSGSGCVSSCRARVWVGSIFLLYWACVSRFGGGCQLAVAEPSPAFALITERAEWVDTKDVKFIDGNVPCFSHLIKA